MHSRWPFMLALAAIAACTEERKSDAELRAQVDAWLQVSDLWGGVAQDADMTDSNADDASASPDTPAADVGVVAGDDVAILDDVDDVVLLSDALNSSDIDASADGDVGSETTVDASMSPSSDVLPGTDADSEGLDAADSLPDSTPDTTGAGVVDVAPDLPLPTDAGTPDGSLPCPVQGCTTMFGNEIGCAGATTIGRKDAAAAKIFYGEMTCGKPNNFVSDDGKCSQGAPDAAYKVYLLKDEKLTASIPGFVTTCASPPTYACGGGTLVLYAATGGCGDKPNCDGLVSLSCQMPTSFIYGNSKCTAGMPTGTKLTFTAPADGWYLLVVDGNYASSYSLTLTLDCAKPGCGC